ncbi:MAG: hypothetical protein M5R40_07450 [Anaerolineae bacterium]|nr:hypothetical protein [Anaerolineae bacterium]
MDVASGRKEDAIVALAAAEVAAGRRVAIYVGQVHQRNPAAFLTPLLEGQGLRVAVLTTAVPPAEREAWLERNGADVLIVNPKLVQTGLDLIGYPVIAFDGIPDFSTYVLMQASRRSWRIGQEKPVDVHFFAYSGTLQSWALELMAAKAAAATAFNGEALEALAAFGEDAGDLFAALRSARAGGGRGPGRPPRRGR